MIRFFIVLGLASTIFSLPTCQDVNFTSKLANHTIKSGYTKIGDKGQGVYYIFYGALNTTVADLSKKPVVVYLEGGPGQSSFLINFQAIGPYDIIQGVNSTYQMTPRNANETWNTEYSLLFIESPIGTGASTAGDASYFANSTSDIASQVLKSLEDFFGNCYSVFTNKSTTPSIILQGHSFAGRVAITLANQIIETNSPLRNYTKGVMAVSPALDMVSNFKQSGMFAYNMGLVDFWERPKIEQGILKTLSAINSGKLVQALTLIDSIRDTTLTMGGGLSRYNLRQYVKDLNTTYPTVIPIFLNANKAVFNIDPALTFSLNNNNVEMALINDVFKPVISEVEKLLNNNTIPLSVIHGQDDALINIPGQILSVDSVNWTSSEQFNNQDLQQWKNPAGDTIGYFKNFGKYEFRTINKAGHNTYIDQPLSSWNATKIFVESAVSIKK